MGNSASCCSSHSNADCISTVEVEKHNPLASLEDLVRISCWNNSQAALAESALHLLYTEARSYEHRRKDFAQNSTLLLSLELSCGAYYQYFKLASLGFQLLDVLAKYLPDGVMIRAAENAMEVFRTHDSEPLKRKCVSVLTTFYRVSPKHRPKLRHMLTNAHNTTTKSVAARSVLNALTSITIAAHTLPIEWASSFEVVSPGWTEINPLLFRCRALEKNKNEYYVLYKVAVDAGAKEMKKFLVINELLHMRAYEGIVPWGAYVHEESYLYVMRPDFSCPSLAEMLDSGTGMDALVFTKQILHILDHCSNSDLSHGGMNPHCIYFNAGVWYVTDWGVERLSNLLRGKLDKTIVTPATAYIAPEARLRKKVKDDPVTDIWACGAILMRIFQRREAVICGAFTSDWLDGLLPDQNIYLSHSVAASKFVTACLQRQPKARIMASEALEHELFDDVVLVLDEKEAELSTPLRRLSRTIQFSVQARPLSAQRPSSAQRPPSAQRAPEKKEPASAKWPTAEKLESFLVKKNVNISKLGVGKARTVQSLFWELCNNESTIETTDDDRICRRVTVVEIKLYVNTAYGRKILRESSHGVEKKNQATRFIVKKVLTHETWEETSHRSLESVLGLTAAFQKSYLQLRGHRVTDEERDGYGNFPGLLSRYRVHTVALQFSTVEDAEVIEAAIGLPDGDPFTTKEMNILGTEREHYWEWALTEVAV